MCHQQTYLNEWLQEVLKKEMIKEGILRNQKKKDIESKNTGK